MGTAKLSAVFRVISTSVRHLWRTATQLLKRIFYTMQSQLLWPLQNHSEDFQIRIKEVLPLESGSSATTSEPICTTHISYMQMKLVRLRSAVAKRFSANPKTS